MGTWGTGISSNDTYAGVYDEFFELYDAGLSVKEITERLIASNQETINEPDSSNDFWFALAKAQWECKELDPDIFDRVRTIIQTGTDLKVWRRQGADEKSIAKRKIVLAKFLAQLQTERPKAKSRKKKVIRQPVFEKGDCLTFKLSKGNFGGAVVLEAIKDTEYGYNLIATTRINQPKKPTVKDFENAEVLVMTFDDWNEKPCIQWYLPVRHKKPSHLIETVDNIKVDIDYNPNKSINVYMADFDISVIEAANKQFEIEEMTPRSPKKQTIMEVTKKKKWKFW
ncbi:MAG: hypothetical protein J0I84_07720 [Terrimonas sp.]|nr:hypothetical protein [Terrimonas sp.]OJY99615.1 MAG: hypothetical protein BGP13_06055 [Sphingobacteriales bacterium 40-81]